MGRPFNYGLGKLRKANHFAPAKPLQVIFVGNEFARKGGIVLLRIAKAALARRLPIRFHVVSATRYAGNIYTDAAKSNHYPKTCGCCRSRT